MKILVTGGGGYVGCELVNNLLHNNHKVTSLDLYLYGEDVMPVHKNFKLIKGDIRNQKLLSEAFKDQDIIIHLACISNDPSFELNPTLGKSINLDAFEPMVKIARDSKVKRFIYASSSSVYGVKQEQNVHEDMSLEPLTDYSIFKANCEEILLRYKSNEFEVVTIRPATVCGYSKRQRLDLVVNILTNLAYNKGKITVFGGNQLRPNIHIKDMIEIYNKVINAESKLVNGQIFNAGYQNLKVIEIAELVKKIIGSHVEIEIKESNDNRSYHISSEKIKNVLDFSSSFTVEDSIIDLKKCFDQKLLIDPLNNIKYYNIKLMNNIQLN
ncbi:SDR family oxidoreductase [Candidatus Pelagibacter sp.]|nr:SDR family oxidoreductase [Candidatus Pelagibacter sp.]